MVVMTNDSATIALLKSCGKEDRRGMHEALQKGADPNVGLDGVPPLMLAAMMADELLVDELLRAGARVDVRDGREGCTVLYYLAANGRSEAHGRIMERLLDAGADVDAQAPGVFGTVGSTPVQMAVQMKNLLAATILEKNGARCTQGLRAAIKRLQAASRQSPRER
jgi:ankyrin repeat protein